MSASGTTVTKPSKKQKQKDVARIQKSVEKILNSDPEFYILTSVVKI